MCRTRLLSFLFVCSTLVSCWAQADMTSVGEGGITGVVLTEEGQLANGEKVCISVRSGNNTSIKCSVSADKEGRFTVEHLKPGTYQVFAINAAEGYSIENQAPGQDVTISEDQPWANITIRLLGKGGVLVGSITDSLTGKRIRRAQIQYTAIDRNGEGGGTLVEGDFHVTIPANCDVLVVVMADGYKGWVYTERPARPGQ